MTKIAKEMVKCFECGRSSEHLNVYSVNYDLGSEEQNERLLNRTQTCPYCGYTNFNISLPRRSKKLIYKIICSDNSEHQKYELCKAFWKIYDDNSFEFVTKNCLDEEFTFNHPINSETIDRIDSLIEASRVYKIFEDVYDGDSWEYIKYNNGEELYHIKSGNIIGITPLKELSDFLGELVGDDIDEAEDKIDEELDKYDIETEDNVPQEVYGIPNPKKELNPKDSLYAKIKKDDQEYSLYIMQIPNEGCYLYVGEDNLRFDEKQYVLKPESFYDEFMNEFEALKLKMEEDKSYSSDVNLAWNIELVTNGIKISLNGSGFKPKEWNDLMDLLSKYEMFYKNEKKK